MTAIFDTASVLSALPEGIQPDGVPDGVKQLELVAPPTNQQILDAARAAYTAYRPAVEATVIAVRNSIQDSSLSDAVQRLNGTNWSGPGLTPALVDPFLASTHVQTAIGVVKTTDLASFGVGVVSGSLPGGLSGVIGFDADLPGTPVVGFKLAGGTLWPFRNEATPNLQYCLWHKAAGQLDDQVLGLSVTMDYGLSLNLTILLDNVLKPYGFVVGAGIGDSGGATVVGGTIESWSS
jgi:hypothetical protein